MITTQNEAYKYAQPYLENQDNKVVYVNQHGLVWVNNEQSQMAEYFEKKNEKYFTFLNIGVDQLVEEQPLIESSLEKEDVLVDDESITTQAPKKRNNKKS